MSWNSNTWSPKTFEIVEPPPSKMYVFTNKYINEFQSSESDEGMKKILKLSNFLNFFEKRAWDTHNAPKPATENFEKAKNLDPM